MGSRRLLWWAAQGAFVLLAGNMPALSAIEAALPRTDAVAVTPLSGIKQRFGCFLIESDWGDDVAAQTRNVARLKPLLEDTVRYFLRTYRLPPTCFSDYADFYAKGGGEERLEPFIRLRIWKRDDDLTADYQARYQTKSLPAAFFGISSVRDAYGKPTSTWMREIATTSEGKTDEQILRHLYHEMGHLFMRTWLLRPGELPSWIEEGNAELFQYRIGNGTRPEAERRERLGYLNEILAEGAIIPWTEFMRIGNMDSLDSTWKDPVRSQIQYLQAWSVTEFMVATPARQEAYLAFLELLKSEFATATPGAAGKDLHEAVRRRVLDRQFALIQKAYGTDLASLENQWKQWLRQTVHDQTLANPVIRYHRGDWHLSYRARLAATDAVHEAEIAKAEALFQECVKVAPRTCEGWVGLGRVAMARSDERTATEAFARAISLDGSNFTALLYDGVALLHTGQAERASASLLKAVAQRPDHPEVNFFAGQALAVSGRDPAKALLCLRRARDQSQDRQVPASLLEGAVLYRSGKHQQAYIAWLRASNQAVDDPGPLLLMAMAKLAQDAHDEVGVILDRIPKSAQAAVDRVRMLMAEKPAGSTVPPIMFTRQGWPTFACFVRGGEGAAQKAERSGR